MVTKISIHGCAKSSFTHYWMLHTSHNDYCLYHSPNPMLWLIGHRSLVECQSWAADLAHPKILAWHPYGHWQQTTNSTNCCMWVVKNFIVTKCLRNIFYNNKLKFPLFGFFVSPALPMMHLASSLTMTGCPCSLLYWKTCDLSSLTLYVIIIYIYTILHNLYNIHNTLRPYILYNTGAVESCSKPTLLFQVRGPHTALEPTSVCQGS